MENTKDPNEKIAKLEKTISFLKKELESQNLAILRLERAIESGEELSSKDKQRPVLTLADMEFTLFGIEEKLKKHNDLLKSIVISLVGINDLLEEVRGFYKDTLVDIQLTQEQQMNAYQQMLIGSVTSLRTEFLLVLRDFREKYPNLEEMKLNEEIQDRKPKISNTLESGDLWTNSQLNDLNRRTEEIDILIDENVNESLININKSINYLLTKTKELDVNLKESKIKKIPDTPI